MGERHDYVALEWVKGEIAETLKQARQALEDYVEHPEDSSRLSFCLTYIHQVHGTLQMVEFFGAALLAEEMEKLAQALLEGSIPNLNEALEVMMQAILQLPLYLERIQAARRDLPMVILPLLNDLRAARDEKLLSETSLFNPAQVPVSTQLSAATLERLNGQNLPEILRKLRQMQQLALVGLLRNQDVERNLGVMARVYAALAKLSHKAPLEPLWQVALGLIEGLANKSLELGTSVRTLLRRLDVELRKLVREQASGLNSEPPADLLKNLLFYVAKTHPNSEHLQELHELYKLTDAVPSELLLDEERARMAGPDKGAMRSVVTALCEELVRIKDQLDLFVRSDRSNQQDLLTLQQPMKQIADTLAVLGFAQPRKVILDQNDILQQIEQGRRTADDGTLMDIAGALLYLEATLTGMVGNSDDEGGQHVPMPTTDVSQIHRVVFKEARTGLEQAKDGIIAFIASQWKHEHLETVPEILNQVRGSLIMLPLPRVAALVDSCKRYVEYELIGRQQIPNWQELDTLADAITSVEYYLERLYEDHESKGETILDVAEQSLANLGYCPVSLEPDTDAELLDDDEQESLPEQIEFGNEDGTGPASPQEVEAVEPVSAEPDGQADDGGLESEQDAATAQTQQDESADESGALLPGTEDLDFAEADRTTTEQPAEADASSEPEDAFGQDAFLQAMDEPETGDSLTLLELPEVELPAAPEISGQQQQDDNQPELVTPTPVLNPPSTQDFPFTLLPPPADEEPVDEELLEIFVEESTEVQEEIAVNYPQWCADWQDKAALTELRRNFHTLKGSGRMVRALVLGELAWSVENLLNRVLEGTLETTAEIVGLVGEVIGLLPELTEEFASQTQRQRDDVDRLANMGHALARKLPIDAFMPPPGQEVDEEAGEPAGVPELSEAEEFLAESLPVETELEAEPLSADSPDASAISAAHLEQDDDEDGEHLSESAEQVLLEAGLDPALIEIFINEALSHLQVLSDFNADCASRLPRAITDELQRSLHTLKGSAHMSGVEPVAAIVSAVEKLVKEYRSHLLQIDEDEARLLSQADVLMREGVQQLDTEPLRPIDGADGLIAGLHELLLNRLDIVNVGQADGSSPKGNPLLIARLMAEDLELLLDMDVQAAQWREGTLPFEVGPELLGELSDLQGAAQMAEAGALVELCDSLMRVYIAADNGQIPVDSELFGWLEQAHHGLIGMLDEVAAGLKVNAQPELVQQLLSQLERQPAQLPEWQSPAPVVREELTGGNEEATQEQRMPQEHTTQTCALPEGEDVVAAEVYSDFDEEMVEIFLEEAMELLESANSALERWLQDNGNSMLMTALMRDLHTLKGGARMAEIKPVGDLSHELEFIYEGLLENRLVIDDGMGRVLLSAHDELAVLLESLQQNQPLVMPQALLENLRELRAGRPATEQLQPAGTEPGFEESVAGEEFVAQADEPELDALLALDTDAGEPAAEPQETVEVDAVLSSSVQDVVDFGRDPELVEIFLEEGFEILESVNASMQSWLENTDNLLHVEALQRGLHTLKGGARMAELNEIGELAHEVEFLYEDICEGKLKANENIIAALHRCHDSLENMLEEVRDNKALTDSRLLLEQIRLLRQNPDADVLAVTGEQALAAQTLGTTQLQQTAEPVDQELLAVFVADAKQHAEQLSHQLEHLLQADGPERQNTLDAALSLLTTLRGGAQLAQLYEVDNLCNRMELELRGGARDAQGVRQLLVRLTDEIERLDGLLAPSAPGQVLKSGEPQANRFLQQQVVQEQPAEPVDAQAEALPFVRRAQQEAKQLAGERTTQEQVRVPSELLEQLVNLAGETSIFRGRVEQQVSDFGYTLTEMEATLDRVRDQLRRLDTETQAQIISRYQEEAEQAEYEDFDPLEMDRYSHLQQLSRSLFESASDLLDLKETLVSKARDTETLLLQQARVNTELQEGLMRTRMVPFERMLPRLRRIVRQVAAELGKQVELRVANAEGEMDRTVLERIVAPLEHLIRNAIGHGIETAEVRREAGKPEKGVIRIDLSREGADILLVMSDDGAGINLEAVRRKAVERGLMVEGAALRDQEIMQFILKSGFSTAEKVTQVSGRGVGMDVVASEIKQVGGTVSIESERGQGTSFIMRLPFTVSVNRALMVMTGDDLYAVPLNVIEGIVRASPYELEALYEQAQETGEAALFEYAGQNYELRYMGELLANGQQPRLTGQLLPLPVILVRSKEHAIAVQVDALLGSREVVVKSLGPQFAAVPGISGATILGDGRVVVILDLMATISGLYARIGSTGPGQVYEGEEKERQKQLLVMIVDDSVTVRKVTSRLLERHGMAVMTAKDGMDAITQLQERKPDIMLLDIEMPRMDGFEVAALVRHDSQLQGLPIIMITSRTGEKHRERAMAMGVDAYMGKPYQEAALLEKIDELTSRAQD